MQNKNIKIIYRIQQNPRILCLLILLSLLAANILWQIWLPSSEYKNNSVILNGPPPNPLKYGFTTGYINSWGVDPNTLVALKSANVIAVGSSICVFAFQSNKFMTLFNEYGLRYQNLCIPGNGVNASGEIIERFNLHPKAVILFYDYVSFEPLFNADNWRNPTPIGWEDIKTFTNLEETIYTRYVMNIITPYIREFFEKKKGISFGGPTMKTQMYRARDGGSYLIYSGAWDNTPVNVKYADYILPDRFNITSEGIARRYIRSLRSRGIQLIIAPLDINSAGELNVGNAKRWAEMLHVPFITPDVQELPVHSDTLDGNHFYGKGSEKLTEAYIDGFRIYLEKSEIFVH